MILPFIPKSRKAYWSLLASEKSIDRAIGEEEVQEFEKDLRALYPTLKKYGIKMPRIDPVRTGEEWWDSTWHEFHLTFLKGLHRGIRNKKFDLLEWNYNVDRKSSERIHKAEEERAKRELERKLEFLIRDINSFLQVRTEQSIDEDDEDSEIGVDPTQEFRLRSIEKRLKELGLSSRVALGAWRIVYLERLLEYLYRGIEEAQEFAEDWRPLS